MSNYTKDLVSIIAICYNHEKYLIETLDSIKNQTHTNTELIIMDDCSSDNSVQKINQWIKENNYSCKFVPHKKNKGLQKTLNEAISYCNGEFIQLISCDDILLHHKIKYQIDIFKTLNNEYGVVYSDGKKIDEYSKDLNTKFMTEHIERVKISQLSGNIFNELAKGNFIPGMSTLIKKEVINEIGEYDEELNYEDYDYWLRVAKKFKFYYTDDVLIKYRIHSNNLYKTLKPNEWQRSDILIGIKHLDNPLFLERTQEKIIDLFYVSNDRFVINRFYKSISINKLKYKSAHFFIKNNFPPIFVKISYRLDKLIARK